MRAVDKIRLYCKLRGAFMDDAFEMLSLFGKASLVAEDLIGMTPPAFINNAQPLFDGDDFCCCNQYKIDDNEGKVCLVFIYYGNNSKKIVDVSLNLL